MKKFKSIALDGLFKQNPLFKLVLGTCPSLAITTSLNNGLGMGLAVVFVLICSNVAISLLRNVIPDKVRIPCYVMVIATFVTVTMLVMNKFLPDLYDSLGVFLPLIVVNCVILARAEAFANSNTVVASAADGLFMGLGYMLGLLLMCFVRELLGAGSLFGMTIWDFRIEIFVKPAGAFFTFGFLIAAFTGISNLIERKMKLKKKPLADENADIQAEVR